jgi:hypothetical protein
MRSSSSTAVSSSANIRFYGPTMVATSAGRGRQAPPSGTWSSGFVDALAAASRIAVHTAAMSASSVASAPIDTRHAAPVEHGRSPVGYARAIDRLDPGRGVRVERIAAKSGQGCPPCASRPPLRRPLQGVAEIGLATGPRLSRARSTLHGVPRPGERRGGDRNGFHDVDNWVHLHIIPKGEPSHE